MTQPTQNSQEQLEAIRALQKVLNEQITKLENLLSPQPQAETLAYDLYDPTKETWTVGTSSYSEPQRRILIAHAPGMFRLLSSLLETPFTETVKIKSVSADAAELITQIRKELSQCQ